MYYIDENPVNLSILNPQSATGGRKYSGQNTDGGEILSKIAAKWQTLVDKYKSDEPITFVRPHMKSGFGEGARGGSYMRQVLIRTANGTKTLTWCDQARKKAGGEVEFLPRRFKHEPETPLIGLTLEKDVEQILWHSLFDGLIDRKYTYPSKDTLGKPHPKAGKTVPGLYILDPNDEAADFLRQGEKSAPMWFYVSNNDSPIASDRDALNFFGSVWGVVKPEALPLAILKQQLIQAIELAESKKDNEYGYDAFAKAVKSYLTKDDTTDIEMVALVNRAVDRGILRYMPSKSAWILQTENGVEIRKLCNVTATHANKPMPVIVSHLLHNDEDLDYVQGSVDAKPIEEKIGKKVYIPEPLTLEHLKLSSKEGGMEFKHMKTICSVCGIESFGKTKPVLADLIYDKLVVQKFPFPAENRLDAPEKTDDKD